MKDQTEKKISLATRLKTFRIRNGLNQRELAAYLGCAAEQVSRWESCLMMPRKGWLDVMAERGVLEKVLRQGGKL